jgi:hypothetical protein
VNTQKVTKNINASRILAGNNVTVAAPLSAVIVKPLMVLTTVCTGCLLNQLSYQFAPTARYFTPTEMNLTNGVNTHETLQSHILSMRRARYTRRTLCNNQ